MGILILQIAIPIALAIFLVLAIESGFRLGRHKSRGSDASKAMETGAIQGAMLGLLGLLLGFSFAGASGRFMERQDLITQEANAIGTAYLRADLLEEPHASALRAALAGYVEHRIKASATLRMGLNQEDAQRIEDAHKQIWAAASQGVLDRPQFAIAVLNPANDVIDLHSTRVATGQKHLPALVIGLLLVCSILTLGVIGYACALARRRNASMTTMIALLIAAALWTTFDLDRPRIGLIRLSDKALHDIDLQPARSAGPDQPTPPEDNSTSTSSGK
ncbi:MAG: hypothetical protein ACTS3F_06800 [Phycisphaerales bacterium]